MKKLRNAWGRVSRGWKLALHLILIGALLFGAWALLDYPALSAASAFRRGFWEEGLRAPALELVAETNSFPLGISADENYSYMSLLGGAPTRHLWICYDVWRVPAADGINYAPLRFDMRGGSNFPYELERVTPAFAVKAPGTDAELSLTLKSGVTGYQDGDETLEREWQGGTFRMTLLGKENGWFIFEFDREELEANLRYGNGTRWYDEPFKTYREWIYAFYSTPWDICRSQLNFTAWDEAGNPVKSAAWEPVPWTLPGQE